MLVFGPPAATSGTGQSSAICRCAATSPQYGVFTTSAPTSTAQRTAQAMSSGRVRDAHGAVRIPAPGVNVADHGQLEAGGLSNRVGNCTQHFPFGVAANKCGNRVRVRTQPDRILGVAKISRASRPS